jgi:hypothetical protein
MRKPVVIGIAFLALVLGVIVYTTLGSAGFRVEVCIEFNGRTNCKIASGASEEFALRTAISNACGEIASGVTDTIACQGAVPKSMVWLKKGKQ